MGHIRQYTPPADPDDGSFELEDGAPTYDRVLSRREKLLRAVVAVGSVALVCFFLLNGPATVARLFAASPVSVRPPAAPPSFAPLSVERLSVPPGALATTLHLSPVNTPDLRALICWTDEPPSGLADLHVARYIATTDTWAALRAPVSRAAACDIAADSANPANALLSVYLKPPATCALPLLYASTDSGTAWTLVPWPDSGLTACTTSVTIHAGHIYAQAESALLPARLLPADTTGRLITTADTRETWHAADTGLARYPDLRLIAFRPGRLLAQTGGGHAISSVILWQSSDDGAHWQSLGEVPGANAQVFASENPAVTDRGGWGSLYLIAESRTNGTTTTPGSIFAARSYPGTGWSPVPLPPPTVVFHGQSTSAIVEAGVGPGDGLIVTRFAPGAGVRGLSSPRRLWLFDAQAKQWRLSTFILPPDASIEGVSWQRHAMRIWLTQASGRTLRGLQVVTLSSGGRLSHSPDMTSR